MVAGVYTFVSFLCIYYLILTLVDAVGSFNKYKIELTLAQDPTTVKIKFDSNLDLSVVSVIYLVSYYLGLFNA